MKWSDKWAGTVSVALWVIMLGLAALGLSVIFYYSHLVYHVP